MTISTSSLLRRCRQSLISLLTCGGVLSSLLMASLVGAPLALVSPPAMATCTFAGSTTATYTYTAANINNAALLPFANTWQCNNAGTNSNSGNICYESIFDGNVAKGSSTMTYTVGLNDTTNNIASMTSGHLYGSTSGSNSNVLTNPVGGTAKSLAPTITVTVPAGQATGMPVGTYSDNTVQFMFDEQGNSGACEGNFAPSTSNWDAIGPVAYTANFVVPSVCTQISTTTVDFGNIPAAITVPGGGISATGAIAVQCNQGAPYTVYVGNGSNYNTTRRMKSGTKYLAYALYQDSAHTIAWNATNVGTVGGAGGVNGTGSGSNQTLTVYALIPAGTAVPTTTGTYTDTVVVTVNY
jgi:spore coat protein U-like protein